MKPKGINVFEQHVEKMVVGAAALVVVGLAARAFLTDPNAVEIDQVKLSPSAVDKHLQSKADVVEQNLRANRQLEYDSPGRLSDWFRAKHQDPTGSADTLVMSFVQPIRLESGPEIAGTDVAAKYAEFVPPAPAQLTVIAGIYSIDSMDVEDIEGLARFVPEEEPYDLSAVHVFATVNGTAVRDALVTPQDDKRAIPSAWFDEDMSILDVVLERQKLQSDGNWTDTEVAPTIPGQVTLRPELADARGRDRDRIVIQSRQLGELLHQPHFYMLVGDDPMWDAKRIRKQAVRDPEVEEAKRQLDLAYRNYQKADRQLTKYLEKQEELRQKQQQRSTGSGSGGDRGGGGGGGVEGGGTIGGRSSGRSGESESSEKENPILKTNEKRRAQASERYEEAVNAILELDPEFTDFPDKGERLSAPGGRSQPGGRSGGATPRGTPEYEGTGEGTMEGGGPEGGGAIGRPTTTRRPGGRRTSGGAPEALPFFESGEIEVWGHDINVVPGATYRYRARILYYNPFFDRAERLSEDQKQLADSIGVQSIATEWSDPVRVTPRHQYYVVNGRYGNGVDDRYASIEVYLFSGGEHRSAEMTVKPGDPIGERRTFALEGTSDDQPDPDATEEPSTVVVNFFTGAVMLDVIDPGGPSVPARQSEVVVALEDGSLIVVDPEVQKSDEERRRLKELAAREPNS